MLAGWRAGMSTRMFQKIRSPKIRFLGEDPSNILFCRLLGDSIDIMGGRPEKEKCIRRRHTEKPWDVAGMMR